MLLGNSYCAGFSLGTPHNDLDVMICPIAVRACFSGQGDIHLTRLFIAGVRVIGYTKLFRLTSMYKTIRISPRLVINEVKDAVTSTPLLNFPEKPWCILAPRIGVESKGPGLKIRVLAVFELHVKFCFYCTEWPTNSDWPSRPRYWPCIADAQRIMSLGCHVVAKSAPRNKENKSWRFSFSVAECELSKLVPDTATKCFLALKIILRDHLQPVVSEIGSYHINTIFLNTMEKLPVGFWADENIEKCFLTLSTELHIALGMMKCPQWLRSCNSLLRKCRQFKRIHLRLSWTMAAGAFRHIVCVFRRRSLPLGTSKKSLSITKRVSFVYAPMMTVCFNKMILWTFGMISPKVQKISVQVTPNKEQHPSQRMEDQKLFCR